MVGIIPQISPRNGGAGVYGDRLRGRNPRFQGGTGERREHKESPGGRAQSGRRKAKRLSLQ
jgi:hypothetical protein